MTTTKNLLSAFLAIVASVSAIAQTQPANPAGEGSNGVLGNRYVDYGFGYYDVNHSRTDAFGAGLTVNVPVASNIDVGVNYSYVWAESHSDIDSHDLSADAIYYIDAGKLKPLGGVTLGYNWNDLDDDWFWGAFGGVEYQATSQLVLTATGGYTADFHDADEGYFEGTLAARFFVTRKVGILGSATLFEGGDVGFVAGVTLKF